VYVAAREVEHLRRPGGDLRVMYQTGLSFVHRLAAQWRVVVRLRLRWILDLEHVAAASTFDRGPGARALVSDRFSEMVCPDVAVVCGPEHRGPAALALGQHQVLRLLGAAGQRR